MKYNKETFEKQTIDLFGSIEGKQWLKHLKFHPEIMYYCSSTKMGKGLEGTVQYFDGCKHTPRIIECIIDNSK